MLALPTIALHALRAALLCALAIPPSPPADIDVLVRTKDGTETSGALAAATFKIKTTLGELAMDVDGVANIQFGQPDVVTRRDGTRVEGKILTDKFIIKTKSGNQTFAASSLARLATLKPAKLVPGAIVDGLAASGVGYHIRAPKNYDPKKSWNAIVILHGSNMNSKAYVNTIAASWPALAEQYILIGINGEQRVKDSPADNPAYNYTYVDFVGRSTYKGFPGTDRESPALVAEAMRELKKQFPIQRFFVGGHSQGAFLTYSILMNYPELIAGAFPVSGGVIFQCEPTAFTDAAVRAAQRRVPVAIVHGENDGIVSFDMSKDAYGIFEDDGFPMVRLFTHKTAAHMFGLLPIDDAVRWLESLACDDPASLVEFAEKAIVAERFCDASAALERARALDKAGKLKPRIATAADTIQKAAGADAKKYTDDITKNANGAWVDGFLAFRQKFGICDATKPALAAFAALREKHQKPADELFQAARADFQNKKPDDGYKKYGEIISKYYASTWYERAKRWIGPR